MKGNVRVNRKQVLIYAGWLCFVVLMRIPNTGYELAEAIVTACVIGVLGLVGILVGEELLDNNS